VKVHIRDHAYIRARERFGWTGGDATTRIERLYEVARYIGVAQGSAHLFIHDATGVQLLVEYRQATAEHPEDTVHIVTLLLPEHTPRLRILNPDPTPTDNEAWTDWLSRNQPTAKVRGSTRS
jgi:hypothetical protein